MSLITRVVASIKLFPEDIISNINGIKEDIRKALPANSSIHKIDEEPIAFGLVALVVHVIMPEVAGELEKVEEAFHEIKGISTVETLLVRRV